ncbi:probable receptor-like protein kinase at1g67000 [Phtheirospermum japonicum]|uniref:Probable receptor-like protein kinase at1g67000 n=1 Tax=Phtheirospermum japonicum TaxID=374723 RepID=A0A830C7M5_9LAMI|nr:probable receptor-like protein kinase at1g67000 [Phtheirospermum japonicum]
MSENKPISRILIFFILFTVNSSLAQNNNPTSSSCPSSSCGNIPEIRYPFRLNANPRSCGYNNPIFELQCQNNQTVMIVSSRRYLVQEINYANYSIRLVDPGIHVSNLSSCPIYSNGYDDWPSTIFTQFLDWNVPVVFIQCLVPVINILDYIQAPFCSNRTSIFANSSDVYSYVMFGERVSLSDLEESCSVGRVVMTSARRPVRGDNGSSLAGIYEGMSYGFELSWFRVLCGECERTFGTCSLDGNRISCTHYCREDTPISQLRFGSGLVSLRFLIGFPFLIGLVIYKWRKRHLSVDETIEEFLQGQNNLTPIKYTYSELKKMTNNFNQRLGEGAFGTVYKGKLRSGPYIAVKMMGRSMASEQEFISEVGTIGRIHHVNVVQLIGFCVEGSKCALVYEYLPNGSLDRYIFSQQGLEAFALRYAKMFEIALGVARGVDYLHCGCDMQILHFDIKPHNILLDENFNPKISDFGLAKLYPTDGSIVNLTAARGTMGYMAPEMFYKNIGGVSYKADVYSFGMLLLEMAGRRKNMNPFSDDVGQIYFPSWAYDRIHAGKDIEIKDADDEERRMVRKIIVVALWCIQMKPSDRPSMSKVVEMLEGDCELQMPPKPFVAPREITEDQ